MKDCDRFGDEILDTRAASAVSAALGSHLAACADCRALADQHFALFARMQSIQLAPPPSAFAAIAARVEAPAPSFFERWFGSWQLPALALAGACAVLVFATSGRDGLPFRAGGSFSVAAHEQPATGHLALGSSKCVVYADSWVELKPDPASQVRFEGIGEFELVARNRLRIKSGSARFDLGPQPGGYAIDVEGGQVRVIGTRFTLDVNHEGTRVKVEHGVVEVEPRVGETKRLEAGGEAWLQPTGSIKPDPAPEIVKPALEPGAHQAPIASREPLRPASAPATPASPPSIRAVRPGGRATGGF